MAGPLTLGEIASRLGGRVAGDPQTEIRQVGSLKRAASGEIAFLSSNKHKAELAATRASAVIVSSENEKLSELPRIVCDNPYAYFARVSQLFNPPTVQAPGIDGNASISKTAHGQRPWSPMQVGSLPTSRACSLVRASQPITRTLPFGSGSTS